MNSYQVTKLEAALGISLELIQRHDFAYLQASNGSQIYYTPNRRTGHHSHWTVETTDHKIHAVAIADYTTMATLLEVAA